MSKNISPTETEKDQLCINCVGWLTKETDEPCFSCREITVKSNFKRREETCSICNKPRKECR